MLPFCEDFEKEMVYLFSAKQSWGGGVMTICLNKHKPQFSYIVKALENWLLSP